MRQSESYEVGGRAYEMVLMPSGKRVVYTKGRGRYVGTAAGRENAEALCEEDAEKRND